VAFDQTGNRSLPRKINYFRSLTDVPGYFFGGTNGRNQIAVHGNRFRSRHAGVDRYDIAVRQNEIGNRMLVRDVRFAVTGEKQQ
jgi:hypothetical protein